MHKIQCAMDPSRVRDLLRLALAATQGGSLIRRLDCVLMIVEGHSVQEVSDWFGVGKRSVQRWVHAAYVSGIDGLRDQHHGGRRPILTPEQVLAAHLDLKSLPDACDMSDLRWTGKRLALHLDRSMGIKISVRTCQRLIARSRRDGLTAPR